MSDLSDFFRLISQEKKRQEEEFKELIGGSVEEIVESLFTAPKKRKNYRKFKKNQEVKAEKEDLIENSLGLLSDPSNIKNSEDSLAPMNQNFATLDDLQNHYKIFFNRIQQQLSTLGGGGETNLTYMDVPVTTVTTSSYYVSHKDYYIGVNYSGAVTITLPKSEREGKIFVIKDESGEASKGTNRYITILPTNGDLIDGRDRAILAYNYGSLTFIWKGNSWRVV